MFPFFAKYRLLLLAAAFVAAFGSGMALMRTIKNAEIVKMERDQATALAAATETARLKERSWNKQLEDARNEATKREAIIRRDAGRARDAANGLRGELAEIRRNLPSLATDAARERADTLAELFGECTARYSELAEKAGRHTNDVQTLTDSWPK